MQRPTIYDVARRAGVSHQTVTRFLNGFKGIRPDTREKVRLALEELGYRPNSAARFLRSKQTNRIGVLAYNMALSGPGRIIAGATLAARSRGYVLDIVSVDGEKAESTSEALDLVLEHQIAGVFVTAETDLVSGALLTRSNMVPNIVYGDKALLVADHMSNPGRILAAHLFELGHRRVGFLNGAKGNIASDERRAGFVANAHKCEMELVWESAGDWFAESGYEAAKLIPIKEKSITAIAVANDSMAVGFIYGLAERGIQVPKDVSVAGIDDSPESRFLLPSLSTVRLDFEGEGAFLMNNLISLTQGNTIKSQPSFNLPTMIHRASTRAI